MTTALITVEIPRFCTALAEWFACLLFVFLVKKRFGRGVTILLNVIFLVADLVFMTATEPLLTGLAAFVVNLLLSGCLMGAQICSCCKVSAGNALPLAGFAFALAQLGACLAWFVCGFLWFGQPVQGHLPGIVTVILLVQAGLVCLLFFMFHRYLGNTENPEFRMVDRILVPAVAIAFMIVSNICLFGARGWDGQMLFMSVLVQLLVDFLGVAVLYVYISQIFSSRMEREVTMIRSLMESQHAQYEQAKESMELVQIRYHDLKHQIEYLRNRGKTEYLDRMDAEIRAFGAQDETGNPVLDTILTSKDLYCTNHDIEFTCVADGTLLSFVDEVDLCNMFGNALDNAIEASERIADPEKRMIHVTVSKSGNFAAIRVENYYENGGNVFTVDHLETTKEDKSMHGFGVRSIRRTAQAYGGIVNITADHQWFSLCILLPLPAAA